jgi:hypothetical protein
MFPSGFGPIIDQVNENQFASLVTLRANLAPFLSIPSFAAIAATLTEQEKGLAEKLKAKKEATDLVATLEAQENMGRGKIREQLQSAYGRLRDLYKSNPKRAERFFERSRKSKPRSR